METAIIRYEDTAPLREGDKCDIYDYLTAAGCGALAGLVDIFMVGAPGQSCIGAWTDKQMDSCVMKFAKMCGWTGKKPDAKCTDVSSAITFLENKFRINYDQRSSADVGDMFRMGTKNHHFKSLAHSPDIVGLFFSILNQFTSTSTFLSDGKLITIETDDFELHGTNFITKLFAGTANWFGHIMSDAAGSSGGRSSASNGRGSGVPMPFFELFGLCDFGKFPVGKDKQTLAKLAAMTFQEGYDLRFGAAMAIPVALCDLTIRLIWSLRRYFQYGKPLEECIPTEKHDDLRVMLLVGNGTLCLMDGADAAIRSGGNWVKFFTRFNIMAWYRFLSMVIKEICIRAGISSPMQKQIEAFYRINRATNQYLMELKKLDIDSYRRETEKYHKAAKLLESADSDRQLSAVLEEIYREMDIEMPWEGDFDEFMSDRSKRMTFKA